MHLVLGKNCYQLAVNILAAIASVMMAPRNEEVVKSPWFY